MLNSWKADRVDVKNFAEPIFLWRRQNREGTQRSDRILKFAFPVAQLQEGRLTVCDPEKMVYLLWLYISIG